MSDSGSDFQVESYADLLKQLSDVCAGLRTHTHALYVHLQDNGRDEDAKELAALNERTTLRLVHAEGAKTEEEEDTELGILQGCLEDMVKLMERMGYRDVAPDNASALDAFRAQFLA